MSQSRDLNAAMPHWHLDCRIESELPEDNVVGTRFLINVLFGAAAVAAMLFAGWLSYLDLTIRRQIGDWELRIKGNRAEVLDIKRMQGDYSVASAKIDEAYRLIKPQLHVYDFLANLGRTRPQPIAIESIEWNEAAIIVHGNLREAPQTAFLLLGAYVKALKKEEKMAAIFEEISLSNSKRADSGAGAERTESDLINFEITFRFKGKKA